MTSADDQLCAALEHYFRIQLAGSGPSTIAHDEVNLGALVERANAAVSRVFSQAAEREQWLYFRISAASTAEANVMIATHIAPMLQQWKGDGSIRGWWWLNKSDSFGNAVRLRIQALQRSRREIEAAAKKQLKDFDCQFAMLCYEPELRLFGGTVGMRIAHDQFCADSGFLSEWMRESGHGRLPIIPAVLSVAVIFRLLRAAGLDLFESWDVFDRVCHKRPVGNAPSWGAPDIQRIAAKVVRFGPDAVCDLHEGTKRTLLAGYGDALDSLGRKLNRTYFRGHLDCGIREFLVPVILFHWNRIGMPGVVQTALCHAVARELSDLSRKSATQREVDAVSSANSQEHSFANRKTEATPTY
jgi:thiopeptide-type bacteriocin biosynthesis protein